MPNEGIPVAVDDVMNQLKSTVYQEAGIDFVGPLRDFKGSMTGINGRMRKLGTRDALEILFNFSDVEVEPGGSTEPYTSPIAQMAVLHGDKKGQAMQVLDASRDKLVNVDTDGNPIPKFGEDGQPNPDYKNWDALFGTIQHWKYTPGHPIRKKNKGTGEYEDAVAGMWEVLEISEEAPAPVKKIAAKDIAISVLNGKTEAQFTQAIFTNTKFKAADTDKKVFNSITKKTFIPALLEAGEVVVDEAGVYSKPE